MKADVMTVSPFSFSSHNLNHHKMPSRIDYFKGEKVGNFIFVRDVISKGKEREAVFICPSCNKENIAKVGNIKAGKIKVCLICYKKSQFGKSAPNYRHGKSETRLDNIYTGIKQRCYNKNTPQYKDYGGRGILVSEEFLLDKVAFFNYVSSLKNSGEKDLTLDRTDNDKGYERGNLRWATRSVQNNNQRVRKDNLSGVRGISTQPGGYTVKVKGVYIGYYKKLEDAILAKKLYDEKT